MNPFLEQIYSDKTVLALRQKVGLAELKPRTEVFTAYLHEEMRLCYLNGHDHAAIVTACALIDFAVKDGIEFDAYVKADCVFDPDEWDKIDALNFGQAINRAKSRGVVTKQEWKELEWLREHIRNVYMHGQTPHWIKDKDNKIVEGNLETGDVEERQVKVRENIFLQRYIRIFADRNVCDDVVRRVDSLVRTLAQRAVSALEDWKTANPSKPTREQVERVLKNMQKKGLEAELIITSDYPSDVLPAPQQSEQEGDPE